MGEGRGRELLQLDEGEEGQVTKLETIMIMIVIIILIMLSNSDYFRQSHFLILDLTVSGGRRLRGATKVDHNHRGTLLKREPGPTIFKWRGNVCSIIRKDEYCNLIESRLAQRNSILRMGNCQSC